MHLLRLPHHRRAGLWLATVTVTGVSLLLRLLSPAWMIADTPHDEGLYARLAGHVVDGDWFGPYTELTLAKGPTYPLFIAGVYELHLPLKLAEHLVHLAAAAVVAVAVARLARSRLLGVVTYAVVALDPAYLGAPAAKVSRDGLYGSLSLLLVGGLVLFLCLVPDLVGRGPRWSVPTAAVAGLGLGATAAGYVLCREERPWLAPAVVLAVAAGLAHWWARRPVTLRHGAVALGAAAVAGLTFLASVGWVAGRNETRYGTSVTSDLVEGTIPEALAQWRRVEAGPPGYRVPVTHAQRMAVYEVSPAARELQPFLDGDTNPWLGRGCTPATCEYLGAFFTWALRTAATEAGHQPTGREAQRFFGQLAEEIDAACGTTLRCRSVGWGRFLQTSDIDAGQLWSSYRRTVADILSYDVGEPERAFPSGGSPEAWATMAHPVRGIDDQDAHLATEQARVDDQWPVALLTDLYRWGARLGAPLALAGLLAAAATRAGRRRLPVLLLTAAALSAVLLRAAVVAVLDAASFPAVGIGVYVLPGFDFLVLFVVLGCWALVEVVQDRRRPEVATAGAPGPAGGGVETPDGPGGPGGPLTLGDAGIPGDDDLPCGDGGTPDTRGPRQPTPHERKVHPR